MPRRLSVVSDPAIPNPVTCIQANDAVLFDVSNQNYPVYVKDSLLNTVQNFDYSDFIALKEKAASSATVSSFAFTFIVPGTYVFASSADPTKIAIIAVMQADVGCTTEAVFTPLTQSNLAAINVKTTTDYILTPDWSLIGGLLGGLIFVIFGVISTMYYFRQKAWSVGSGLMPRYRKKALTKKMDELNSKGTVLRKGAAKNNEMAEVSLHR